MKVKLFVFHFLLLFILIDYGISQDDWRPGYVIMESGDTLHGLVDYRSPISNSFNCYFRENMESESRLYTPQELLAYRFENGKFYISRVINIDNHEELVFLEFLVDGEVNLYYFGSNKACYFLEKDGELHALTNTMKTRIVGDMEFVTAQKEYTGTLNYHLQDAQMNHEINSSKLSHKSLIGLVRNYHEEVCSTEDCIIYEEQITPPRLGYGVKFGKQFFLTNNQETIDIYSLFGAQHYAGLVFSVHNIPGIYERFSLRGEFNFSTYTLENWGREFQISTPVTVNYRLSAKKLYPEFELGAAPNVLLGSFGFVYLTWIAGVRLHYELFKTGSVYLNFRLESIKPGFWLSGGIMF